MRWSCDFGGHLELFNENAHFIAYLYTNIQLIKYKSVRTLCNQCINITATLYKQNKTKIIIISSFFRKLQSFQKWILCVDFDNLRAKIDVNWEIHKYIFGYYNNLKFSKYHINKFKLDKSKQQTTQTHQKKFQVTMSSDKVVVGSHMILGTDISKPSSKYGWFNSGSSGRG